MSNVIQLTVLIFWISIYPCIGAEECSRYSPQEIWYSDYSPWLNQTIEEMKVYFQVVFGKLDGNLFNLMPHIEAIETENRKLIEAVRRVEEKLSANLESHYGEIERSWMQLSHNTEDSIRHIKHLQYVHVTSNKSLDNALAEVASFFTLLSEHVVEGVTRVLETELETAPENEAALAKLIRDKISQLAPSDLLGTVVSRFIARKLEPMSNLSAQSSTPILFNEIISRIDKMADDAEMLGDDEWPQFWQQMLFESIEATNQRRGNQNFRRIFSNDVYVAEILMNLMQYYSNQ